MLVADLDEAVAVADAAENPQSRELRRTWGQLEILNAIALDEGRALTMDEVADASSLVDEVLQILGHGGEEGRATADN